MQLGKQEMECPAQVVEVGLKRQDRQYALEYSFYPPERSKFLPQENLLAHAKERIPWDV